MIASAALIVPWTRNGYAGAAEVYLALWEAGNPEYARAARQACAASRKYARVFPIGEAWAGLYQGLAAWLDGHPARALRAWQKGLAAAERLAMLDEEGRAYYEIGRHLPAGAPARRQHLERACALFQRLGARYDLARADRALGGRGDQAPLPAPGHGSHAGHLGDRDGALGPRGQGDQSADL